MKKKLGHYITFYYCEMENLRKGILNSYFIYN